MLNKSCYFIKYGTIMASVNESMLQRLPYQTDKLCGINDGSLQILH